MFLFVAQGHDGIQARGLHGRPHPKEQTYTYGYKESGRHRPERDGGGKVREADEKRQKVTA
jgi:hypothetical protein